MTMANPNEEVEAEKVKAAVDPKHYQDFIDGLQWLEAMNRMPRYRDNPFEFIAAVELQIRKYMDRNGRKDNMHQEYKKGLWYYKYLVAYMANGMQPIRVKDIEKLLKK